MSGLDQVLDSLIEGYDEPEEKQFGVLRVLEQINKEHNGAIQSEVGSWLEACNQSESPSIALLRVIVYRIKRKKLS